MEQTQELLGGNDENAEHQMGVHLGSAAHEHMVPPVVILILKQPVDPLRLAARLVAFGFMRGKFDLLPPRRALWSINGTCPSWRDTARMIPL